MIDFQIAARYALVVWVPVHFLGMDWKASSSLTDPKVGHVIDTTAHTTIIFPVVAGLCGASVITPILIKC